MEHEALVRDVGPRVAALRRLAGLSRSELAERVEGADMMWVVALEDGNANPSMDDIERVAEALELPPSELLSPPVQKSWWGKVQRLLQRAS